MGDKSPKAKDRARKQEAVRQTHVKAAADLKAAKPAPGAVPVKAKKP